MLKCMFTCIVRGRLEGRRSSTPQRQGRGICKIRQKPDGQKAVPTSHADWGESQPVHKRERQAPFLGRHQSLIDKAGRLTGEDALDGGEFFLAEVEMVERRYVVFDLLDAACADQRRGHAGMTQHPRDCHLRE
jgi:hypothetical protein